MAIKQAEKSRTKHVWLTMYADFITTLTIFFILLFYGAMLQARKTMSDEEQADYNSDISDAVYDRENKAEKAAESKEAAVGATKLDDGRQLKDIAGIAVNRRELDITLPESLLFESGKAKLNEEAKPIVRRLGQLILQYPGKVAIEGHTDDVPIHQLPPPGMRTWELAFARASGDGPYASNWELSAARAVQVVHLLTREKVVPPEKLVAKAYGPSTPLYPNDTEEHRALNRRIEIKAQLK
ncbi:MAG: flagellar motor protein MotB [Elusimicrobia bacterium]|nr:flagellar motor protein MotB [Elusimicrobiota bacterium]